MATEQDLFHMERLWREQRDRITQMKEAFEKIEVIASRFDMQQGPFHQIKQLARIGITL